MSKFEVKPETSQESVIYHASKILKMLESPVKAESKTMELVELAYKLGLLASCIL